MTWTLPLIRLVIKARRDIIEHCLYGVDINEMAVEMAKLSLWLVSMDPLTPFTFLDDKLACRRLPARHHVASSSLEWMHLDPAEGRKLHESVVVLDFMAGVRSLLSDVVEQRRPWSTSPTTRTASQRSARSSTEVRKKTADLSLYADLIVGTALSKGSWLDAAKQANEGPTDKTKQVAKRLLAKDRPDGAFDRHPLHWPLVFPEVFREMNPGFDAIIGNPPFLGGWKIRDSVGDSYKNLIVELIGGNVRGVRGTADLVAYFALRAYALVSGTGQMGLVATNTIAQGDTRTVGLDQIVESGATIRQSVKSEPWPSSSAVLEYAAVWASRVKPGPSAELAADGVVVEGITSSLDPFSRVVGRPYALHGSGIAAFHGWKILGDGFLVDPGRADDLISRDLRNKEVLFPFLNGRDVNSRPDNSASRWAIHFHNWSEDKAKTYVECYDQVRRLVRLERADNKIKSRRERWWLYAEYLRGLVEATAALDRVITITFVSKVVMPVMVPTGQIFSHALAVFATDDTGALALLSSAPHYWWAITRSSTMKGDLRYTLAEVFGTLPLPGITAEMRTVGNRLDTFRREFMLARQAGLTATYNLVHEPKCIDSNIVELRDIHRVIDEAVVSAYGWTDLVNSLDHGFHDTRQGTRYTIGTVVRQEILDRLLELNHARYAAEVKAGLNKPRKKRPTADDGDMALF